MAGEVSGDLAADGITQEIQVADDVQDLVADELVAEAELRVEHATLADDDGILQRAPVRQLGQGIV